MHFLYIKALGSYEDLPWAITQLGHDITMFPVVDFNPTDVTDNRYALIASELDNVNYDYVISYFFLPQLSDICQKLSVRYISWTYDSPLLSLFSESLIHPCNYTFVFDYDEYTYFHSQGIFQIYYLPMAVNTKRTSELQISPRDIEDFSCDISFVGNLYEDNSYNKSIQILPEQYQIYLKNYLMKNLCRWDTPKPWPALPNEMTDFLCSTYKANAQNKYDMPDSLFLGNLFLTRKLAEMDRLTVLNTLAEQYHVDLYTGSQSGYLSNIHVHPPVDYKTQMSKVFTLSKINLNITLPSIVTGIPQRIFDIMGSGGFVLTNYQKDLEKYFEIGTDLEVFYNLEDLKEKVQYYLTHNNERKKIALNGYQKVLAKHNYVTRVSELLEMLPDNAN